MSVNYIVYLFMNLNALSLFQSLYIDSDTISLNNFILSVFQIINLLG